jgi:hypothetical protein
MAKFDIKVRSELIATRFNAYLQELWALDPRIEFSDLIRAEATAVMMGAMGRTRAASEQKIRAASDTREWATLGGKRYRLGGRTGEGWHLPDTTHQAIQDKRAARLTTKIGARGLSKQSFANLAKVIGGRIGAIPGYVSSANYQGRRYPENVSALEASTPAGFILTTFNNSPIVGFAGGAWAILGAMQGRVSYFRRNMKHRRFQTLASRARAYPGIWATETAP